MVSCILSLTTVIHSSVFFTLLFNSSLEPLTLCNIDLSFVIFFFFFKKCIIYFASESGAEERFTSGESQTTGSMVQCVDLRVQDSLLFSVQSMASLLSLCVIQRDF